MEAMIDLLSGLAFVGMILLPFAMTSGPRPSPVRVISKTLPKP
jgi:hypothetical protein